ncbi:MAG: hypothetical protein WBP26_03215 [Candidatus Saccharimonadales bacterium]
MAGFEAPEATRYGNNPLSGGGTALPLIARLHLADSSFQELFLYAANKYGGNLALSNRDIRNVLHPEIYVPAIGKNEINPTAQPYLDLAKWLDGFQPLSFTGITKLYTRSIQKGDSRHHDIIAHTRPYDSQAIQSLSSITRFWNVLNRHNIHVPQNMNHGIYTVIGHIAAMDTNKQDIPYTVQSENFAVASASLHINTRRPPRVTTAITPRQRPA